MGPKRLVDGSLDAKKCPTHETGRVGPKKKKKKNLAKTGPDGSRTTVRACVTVFFALWSVFQVLRF
jgi:hypothetical protein